MQMEVMVEMTYAEDAVNLKTEDIFFFPCIVLPLSLTRYFQYSMEEEGRKITLTTHFRSRT